MEEQIHLLQLYGAIKAKGLKLTPVRKILLEIFYDHRNKLLKTNEIYDMVRQSKAMTNFSTIYRNLETLEQSSIIEKLYYDGSTKYKIIIDETEHRNHHMICTLCHKTEPLPYCPVRELEAVLKADNGFLPLDHKIEIYGHCKTCRYKLLPLG